MKYLTFTGHDSSLIQERQATIYEYQCNMLTHSSHKTEYLPQKWVASIGHPFLDLKI